MSDETHHTTRAAALRLTGNVAAAAWTATGLLLPVVIGVLDPAQLVNGTIALTLLLVVFAMAGSNVELTFIQRDNAPVYSPVGVPIVLATVACTPAQAMLVVALGYLLDRNTWKRHWRKALESAGLGVTSVGVAAWLVTALGLSFSSPGATMVAAIVGTCAFLLMDAATYTLWYQVESGSGVDVLRYFANAAPVDVSFTAIAVVLAGPFTDNLLALAAIVLTSQLAIYALYRMISSESRYRAQSHHLRDVFGRYVPETVVEQLAGRDSIQLGGEARDVSVMFCDIRGFTSWAEGKEPEAVVAELNDLLGSLAQIVLESQGTLDKFTGDGLMAFWGAPLDQPDHAERACEAAARMHQLIVDRARDATTTPFRIGIGVASGEVVVGNLGHEQRLDYTAIGDTVNLSARLEQSTKELDITTAISHETWERLPTRMRDWCPEVATVQVKGRVQRVRVHELIGQAWATEDASLALDAEEAPVTELPSSTIAS